MLSLGNQPFWPSTIDSKDNFDVTVCCFCIHACKIIIKYGNIEGVTFESNPQVTNKLHVTMAMVVLNMQSSCLPTIIDHNIANSSCQAGGH